MRTWVLLACFSLGVASCDDGDDLEKKDAAGDTRPVDTAPATDTGGEVARDTGTDVARDGGTDVAASTDGGTDRTPTDAVATDRAPDTVTTDATFETGGDGSNTVDAADTAGQ